MQATGRPARSACHEPVSAEAPALRVVQIGFFTDPAARQPQELLAAWPTLVDVAESAALAGVQVAVIQASAYSQAFARNGVDYHFLPLGSGAMPVRADGAFARLVKGIAPHVIHVHGLGFPREVLALSALAPGVPIILQDHADRLPRLWHRSQWRRCAAVISSIAFCSGEQAGDFARAGLLTAGTVIHEIPEATSRFVPGDRAAARRATGANGDPLILWVGHLNSNKDPLTVLEGVAQAARLLPQLQLFCCFGTAPLAEAVERRIVTDSRLASRVHLLGAVPHDRVEQLMRAADIFVLGSRRESTGYALLEALACGLPPVVTDIPSFRALTNGGSVGRLWPPGDARALCEAISAVASRIDPGTRAAVRAQFERELSFAALGSRLARMYDGEVRRRHAGVAS